MDATTIDEIRAVAGRTFDGTPVAFAYLFGSVARGEKRPLSDIDIAVHLDQSDRDERFETALDLGVKLELGLRVPRVDLVVLNDAPLPLAGRIVRDRLVIFSRDEAARVDYEIRTQNEFFDFQIHAEVADRRALKRIAEGRR